MSIWVLVVDPATKVRFLKRLPEGSFVVGGGLFINGLAAYVFITLASRDLGAEAYSPVAMLWALSFLFGPGFFHPLEQETSRTIASRSGHGVIPVLRAAALIGGLAVLFLLVLAGFSAGWVKKNIFSDEPWLLVSLFLVVVGLGLSHLTKGLLAGLGRFGGYARYVIGEGLGRLIIVFILLLVTSGSVGVYGMAIGLAPFVGIVTALIGQRGFLTPGPVVHLSSLSKALGILLVASVATALVLNVSPVVVELLAGHGQENESGRFFNALLIARIPLFFFQAVQASLLPQLSGLVGAGQYERLLRVLNRLLVFLGVVGVLVVIMAALAGPWIVEFTFGSEFAVGRRDMTFLSISSTGLMIVLSLAQGLIACKSRGLMALAWLIGVGFSPVVLILVEDLFLRVELALIVTVFLTAASMALFLVKKIQEEISSKTSEFLRPNC